MTEAGVTKGKKYRFGRIITSEGLLLFDFEVRDLMTKEILNGLRKGMTAALEYQIQLWQERQWVNRLAAEELLRMKVSYDTWEERYIVDMVGGDPQRFNEDDLKAFCSELVEFPVANADELDQDAEYTIAVKIILQPLSVDSYREIRQWLSGEVRQLNPKKITSTQEPGKKAGNWLLGLVLNLTGFGDRVITAKSDRFQLTGGSVVVLERN